MDPYLEDYWPDVHTSMCTDARNQLAPQLPEDLYARLEEYLAVESSVEEKGFKRVPDVKVSERAANGSSGSGGAALAVAVAEPIEIPLVEAEPETLRSVRIYDRTTGNRVVTAIELLSPANKVGEAGRADYRKKQKQLLEGDVSLVEIDLLRAGGHVLAPPLLSFPPECREPYRVSVIRSWRPSRAQVYRISLRERLPAIRIPLRQTDQDVVLDLQPLIDRAYEFGGYERNLDYRKDPQPPLEGGDATWADQLLKAKGRR
jgi:hypothetical protein